MSDLFPDPPETGALMPACHASAEARRLLALRRSAGKMTLTEPGPPRETVEALLRVAARVPDHRRVEPWRFIRIEGETRTAFGQRLAAIAAKRADLSEKDIDAAAGLPLRAPLVIAVVFSPDETHKTPVWEQELSAGAVCFNLLLAASSAGWGACWLTEWIAYDNDVAAELGVDRCERIAGFVYIGTPSAEAPERPRPDMAVKVTDWCPAGEML